MESEYSSRTRTRDLIAFFVLAYALSWVIGVPLALSNRGIIPAVLPSWTHFFYGYGPMLAALIVTWRIEGRRGLREIVSRMFLWNIRPIWWIAALSPLVLGLAVALVLNLTMGSQISLAALGEVQFLPPLGMGALLLWILTFGIGEETGWRGFALPRLQYDRNALLATVILWFFWALWHLPAFFYSLDPAIAPGWLIGQFAGAILFTWLFNSCGGSILIIAVWHGCFNFITSSPSVDGLLAAVVSTMVMIWAIIIVMAFKPAKLSSGEKVVI